MTANATHTSSSSSLLSTASLPSAALRDAPGAHERTRVHLFNLVQGVHHYVGPQNERELRDIHSIARPAAIHYVSSILALYVIGLLVILVHHMNSSYGAWAWGLTDLWTELKPVVDPSCQQGANAKENGHSDGGSVFRRKRRSLRASSDGDVCIEINGAAAKDDSNKKIKSNRRAFLEGSLKILVPGEPGQREKRNGDQFKRIVADEDDEDEDDETSFRLRDRANTMNRSAISMISGTEDERAANAAANNERVANGASSNERSFLLSVEICGDVQQRRTPQIQAKPEVEGEVAEAEKESSKPTPQSVLETQL